MPLKERKTSSEPVTPTNGQLPPMTPDQHTPLLESRRTLGRTTVLAEALREMPWIKNNDAILSGYRRRIPSVRGCMWSAIGYVHNETANIHTHLLGCLTCLVLLGAHLLETPRFSLFPDMLTPRTLADRLCMSIFLLGFVLALGASAFFHTVIPHSRGLCNRANQGDYVGIVLGIQGSIIPSMYYGFEHGLFRYSYMVISLSAAAATAITVLSPRGREERWRRTLAFTALGLSSVIPITHVLFTHGLAWARHTMALDLVICMGASFIFGAVLYGARIPERLSPGTFDLLGSSHQLFHCFVLAGVALQYFALRAMIWGRANAMGSLDHKLDL